MISVSGKLVALVFDNSWREFTAQRQLNLLQKKDKIIIETVKQLKEYFNKKRKIFNLPIEYSGTVFQKQAWKTLQEIPYGQTISYTEQAFRMNKCKAMRAVGGANAKNNICIIIPCHRVIGKNGNLTGFSGGVSIKARLLQFENFK